MNELRGRFGIVRSQVTVLPTQSAANSGSGNSTRNRLEMSVNRIYVYREILN